MKTNLYIINIKEFRKLSGLLLIGIMLSMVANLQFSLKGYIIILFLFVMSKSEPVEEVSEVASSFDLGSNKDILRLKKIYLLDSVKFHTRLYYFNRFVTYILLAGVILHDVLVNLRIIDPVQ